jgi:hypothetical protein
MFAIDRTKTALANFLALVNALSGTSRTYVTGDVTLGTPTADSSVGGFNTAIQMTGVENRGYTGTKTIRYKRLALGSTKSAAAVTFDADQSAGNQAAIDQIAVAHNLVMSDVVVTGGVLAAIGDTATFTLTAAAVSLLYTGSFTADVTTLVPTPSLADIDQTSIDGFGLPTSLAPFDPANTSV